MCCWYCEKATSKPCGENRPGTPLATSWSWRSSDGTVYRLRANEGVGLVYGSLLAGRSADAQCVHRIGRDRIRAQPRPPSGRQRQQAALLSTAESSWRVSDESEAVVDRRRRHANNSRPGHSHANTHCPITTRPDLPAHASPNSSRLCAFHPLDCSRPQSHTVGRPPCHCHPASPGLQPLLRACRPLGASPLYSGLAGPQNGWPRERPIAQWTLWRAALVSLQVGEHVQEVDILGSFPSTL